MSHLDGLFAEGGTDPEVLAAMQAQLSAQQSLIVAQQSALASVQQSIAAGAAAQAAVDALQQTAINAQAALNSTQTAAINAETAANAAQQAAIDALASLSSSQGVHVANYTPIVGGVRQPLTDANFDAALRAAILDAYARVPTTDSANCHVFVPPGVWTINSTIKFPGTFPKNTPGLIGEGGPESVVFVFPPTVYPWIEIGTNDQAIENQILTYTRMHVLKNLSLRSVAGVAHRGGIRVWRSIFSIFEDVRVAGLSGYSPAHYPKWNECIGFDFLQAPAANGGNNQHVRMTRCHADSCVIGYRFGEGLWAATLIDVHADNCIIAGAMYESAAVVQWVGGNTQTGPKLAGVSGLDRWWENTAPAVHCSGANHTTGMPAGTGATCSSPTGGLCTVTGLVGLMGYQIDHSVTHKGCWLELTNPAAPQPDLVSGLYRIEQVLSATSCTIRKGNASGATGLAYQVRGGGGGYNLNLSNIYHEGGAYALMSLGPDWVTASRINIQSCEGNNTLMVVEATGSAGSIRIHDTFAGGGLYAKLRYCNHANIDGDVKYVDADTYSLSRLVARQEFAVWDACPRATRYNRALKERGAVFIADARVASSLAMTGTNVTTWTDLVKGKVGARLNAGIAPQYIAYDAAMGGPAIRVTGGASAAAVGGFEWDLTTSFRARAGCTMLIVARLPDLIVSPAQRMIGLRNTALGDFHVTADYNDGIWNPTGNYCTLYAAGGASSAGAKLGAADTKAQAMVCSTCLISPDAAASHVGHVIGCASDTVDFATGFACFSGEQLFTPNALKLWAPWYNNGTIGDVIISHIAFFDRGLTYQETQRFMDLIRNEFPVNAAI